MFTELSDFARHAASIRRFVATPLSPEDALARMRRGLAERESRFLSTLANAVFAVPASPYRKLLANAGIELGDLERLVADDGIEGTAARLHEPACTSRSTSSWAGRPSSGPVSRLTCSRRTSTTRSSPQGGGARRAGRAATADRSFSTSTTRNGAPSTTWPFSSPTRRRAGLVRSGGRSRHGQ